MRALTLSLAAAACVVCTPATAAVHFFQTTLNGATEVPPVASSGTGTASVSLDDAAHQLIVSMTFSGLSGQTTASHIHAPTAAPFTGNANVATELPSFTGFPLGVSAGTYNHTFDTTLTDTFNPDFVAANGGTALGAETALLAAMQAGESYLNIHTNLFPAGEIRGFLSPSGGVIPEPATWALMIAGFGMAGALLRARRRMEVKISA